MFHMHVLCDSCGLRETLLRSELLHPEEGVVCRGCGSPKTLTRLDPICTGCGVLVNMGDEYCQKCETENREFGIGEGPPYDAATATGMYDHDDMN